MRAILNINKALDFILFKFYQQEYEHLDGYYGHKDGLNYYEWLYKHKIIDEEQFDLIMNEIKLEDQPKKTVEEVIEEYEKSKNNNFNRIEEIKNIIKNSGWES